MRCVLILCVTSGLLACRSPYPKYTGGTYEVPVRAAFRAPEEPLLERSVTTLTEATAEDPAPRVETVEVVSESRFTEAEEGGGWLLEQRSTPRTEDAQGPVATALARAFAATPMRVELASDGSFIRLLNAQALSQAVWEALPADFPRERLAALLAPDSLEEEARDEWATRFGPWFGRNVSVGQAAYSLERLPLAGGRTLAFIVERRVAGVVEGARGRVLVLALRCPTETAAELAALAGDVKLDPSVRCEGAQQLNLEPFLPLTSELTLSATPEGGGEVRFTRKSELLPTR